MKRDHPETDYNREDYHATNFVPGAEIGKFHMDKTPPDAGGADELLAAVGYKVRASEMADVAEKLLQLEMAMGCGQEDSVITHFASDTVHYNPSDINTWLETMLSEINSPALLPSSPAGYFHESSGEADSSTITTVDFPNARSYGSDCDLRAIPGDAVYADSGFRETKRMKPEQAVPEPVRPVVVLDSQEAGIRLVHALMACAESVERNNLKDAESLLRQISLLAGSQAGAMRKVATCFAEALARRIFRFYPSKDPLNPSFSDMLERHMYETCPYLKFAHFTANQAILEAFAGKSHVHVIDFSMKQGLQWPALMQALALRPGGPPVFRLTGIGPPQPDSSDPLQEVGFNLARLAETMHVEFEYRGLVCSSLADLEPHMLHVRADVEAVAVNSVFELHRLLSRPGAIEKVLAAVKAVGPRIVTVVEQEANHNGPGFAERFNEALHYYSTVFDSVEGSGSDEGLTEVYLGEKICDVVACEGAERVERHERLDRWRGRMAETGFEAVHLGSNAFKQASTLLALFGGGEGYRVEERNGCLLLGWHTRPLIATSAWHVPQPVRR